MPVTKDQARILTSLIVASRPHGAPRWDEPGIMAALAKVADRSLPEVVIASIRAACDASARNPGVIAAPGKAWDSDTVPIEAKSRPHPPKRGQDCPRHPGQFADRCGGCRADQLAGPDDDEDTPDSPPPSWQPGDTKAGAAMCRAAIKGDA
ncbi:hypothetical protein [Nocardioides terrisoli]|uniref:hypothetical protein n=1 Tax=Nocardioides terrisoli TaxID=3388267 RepID=UPI00287B91DC|nr:hypothetical protein [Nocardioides marmorisolisilvae]